MTNDVPVEIVEIQGLTSVGEILRHFMIGSFAPNSASSWMIEPKHHTTRCPNAHLRCVSSSMSHPDSFLGSVSPSLDVKRLKILTSNAVCPLICIYSQSWGSSVDALNTTYPSPLPDHRVLLAVVFVPCAHALASTPTGCISMIYFCT